MSQAKPSTMLRSVGAIVAGVLVGVILSLGTDLAMQAIGVVPAIRPAGGKPASTAGNDLSDALWRSGRLHHGEACAGSPYETRHDSGHFGIHREHRRRRTDLEQGSGFRTSLVSGCAGDISAPDGMARRQAAHRAAAGGGMVSRDNSEVECGVMRFSRFAATARRSACR